MVLGANVYTFRGSWTPRLLYHYHKQHLVELSTHQSHRSRSLLQASVRFSTSWHCDACRMLRLRPAQHQWATKTEMQDTCGFIFSPAAWSLESTMEHEHLADRKLPPSCRNTPCARHCMHDEHLCGCRTIGKRKVTIVVLLLY